MQIQIDPILLSKVQKPARYVGGEWNSVVKNHSDVDFTVAYCFPDVYEVAMSHLGLRILYALLNKRSDTAAERVYAPWPDMEELMRKKGYPLYSLETKTAVRDFDMVGFTLQYEMSFTNILNMLDLAGIPLLHRNVVKKPRLLLPGGLVPIIPNPWPNTLISFVSANRRNRFNYWLTRLLLGRKPVSRAGKKVC